jgi:PIN domain nuclease of toxin-antitoxin system
VKVLLDTHTLLWSALDPARLGAAATAAILDPANEKLVSPASYWEIAIKISVGKYSLTQSYETFLVNAIDHNGFHYLPIEPRHTAVLITLPYHHRDPFDRLLVAQAVVDGLPLLSNDTRLDAYPITRVW